MQKPIFTPGDRDSIPFKANVHGGLSEADGFLSCEAEHLRIAYEIKDAVAGLLKSSHEATIPFVEIDDLRFRPGWLSGKLTIRVLEADQLAQIPWRNGAEFTVKVKNRDADRAADLVEEFVWIDRSQTTPLEAGSG